MRPRVLCWCGVLAAMKRVMQKRRALPITILLTSATRPLRLRIPAMVDEPPPPYMYELPITEVGEAGPILQILRHLLLAGPLAKSCARPQQDIHHARQGPFEVIL